MSIAVKTLPRSTEDRDSKFVNFTEEFRKAKRASLTWSAITIFVALAPDWGREARYAGLTIPYGQVAFAGLLFLVASYYFAAFLRQLQIVRELNSEAALDAAKEWNSIREIINSWKARIRPLSGEIEKAEATAKSLVQRTDAGKRLLARSFEHWTHHVDGVESRLSQLISDGRSSNDSLIREFVSVYRGYTDELQKMRPKWESQYLSEIATVESEMSDMVQTVDQIRDRIEAFESSLSRFRSSISSAERNWHTWHDRVAVCAAFGAAAWLFVLRLLIENLLGPISALS